MSIDLDSQFPFGDEEGLKNFFLVHRFSHESYETKLQTLYGASFLTLGLSSEAAEEAWAALMRDKKGPPAPEVLDWLQMHAALHTAEYALIGGSGNIPPDLSIVDFSDERQFYDWMQAHQEMHDYTDSQLGV